MPNATHPLHDLDCETLTRTLDLLTQRTRDISDTWGQHQPQVLRERLAEVQDILTRAIDLNATIENHETGETGSDTIKPVDPWKRDSIAQSIGEAFGIQTGTEIPQWVWDAAEKVIALDT